ncbi:hypothetical protein [Chryseobacterium sp. JK1]|uniref:hypothetical protein n=1 Tax=Chryseobacterium sp. JK1 TaxID=874294 RepID=UPI003D6954F0
MHQDDIDLFIERNLKNFSVNSTGWNEIIRQMLFELVIGGWNLEKDVFGKEKNGELRCRIYSENSELNAVMKTLTGKYMALSATVCEICGSQGKKREEDSGETTLCLNHYLERKPVVNIDNRLNIKVRNKIILNIREIAKAEIDYDLQTLWLFRNEETSDKMDADCFSWQQPNYYLLLKTIPLYLFPEDQQQEIFELFEHLENCEICGNQSVYRKWCLRCRHEPWNDSKINLEGYKDKSDYIKSCQMDRFLDEDDYEKYGKHDISFERAKDHKILFNHHDLREYEKLHF